MAFPALFMRPIDRVRSARKIASALIDEMDAKEINVFFGRMGMSRPDNWSRYGPSTLADIYLGKCDDAMLLEIAEQLGLTVEESAPTVRSKIGESKYWINNHFRVFISHHHSTKVSAHHLRDELLRYGISSFVAHDDIKVSAEWRDEILKSLVSMDALVAILNKEFKESTWTDQEVGAAVCRDVLVIPINKGIMPYGFLEALQTLNSSSMSVAQVAEKVFDTICENPRTAPKMIDCLVKTIPSAPDIGTASFA